MRHVLVNHSTEEWHRLGSLGLGMSQPPEAAWQRDIRDQIVHLASSQPIAGLSPQFKVQGQNATSWTFLGLYRGTGQGFPPSIELATGSIQIVDKTEAKD